MLVVNIVSLEHTFVYQHSFGSERMLFSAFRSVIGSVHQKAGGPSFCRKDAREPFTKLSLFRSFTILKFSTFFYLKLNHSTGREKKNSYKYIYIYTYIRK